MLRDRASKNREMRHVAHSPRSFVCFFFFRNIIITKQSNQLFYFYERALNYLLLVRARRWMHEKAIVGIEHATFSNKSKICILQIDVRFRPFQNLAPSNDLAILDTAAFWGYRNTRFRDFQPISSFRWGIDFFPVHLSKLGSCTLFLQSFAAHIAYYVGRAKWKANRPAGR